MANKRMFSREIVTSDAFLMMSTAAQAVYIQLCMNADDDGFVNSPVIVCRMTGATQGELEELKRSKFIYQFASGVVVIKHWRIHNNIRGDRKKDTNYKDEMEMLEVKDNGAYTFREELDSEETDADDIRKLDELNCGQSAAECQSSDGKVADNPPQNDSIDKYSIDKIRLDKYSIPPKGGVGEKEKPTKMQNKFKEMLAGAELSDSLKDKLTEWLEYKTEIKKPYKSETGFKQFLGTVSNYSRKFPDTEIIDAISQSMANGYQGIVWDYLGRKKPKAEPKKPENANNLQALADYWQNEI